MQKLLVFLFIFISFNSFSQQLLKDIGEGNENTFYKNHEEYNTEAFNDSLFLVIKKSEIGFIETLCLVKNGLDTVYNYPISGIQFNNIFFIKKEGGLLFIGDADNSNNLKLYCIKGDGSSEIILSGLYSGIHAIKIFKIQNSLVFTYTNGNTSFYRTNGTLSGTVNFYNMSFNNDIFKFNDKLYFSANASSLGDELWVLDSPNSSPFVLKDIRNGSPNSFPRGFKIDGDKFYFNALVDQNSSNQFYGLFESDGTSQGTQLIYPQPYTDGGFNASQIIKNNSLIYYSRYNSVDVLDKTTLNRTILFNGDRGMFKSFKINNEVYGILRSANPLGQDDLELWKLGTSPSTCTKIKTLSTRVWFFNIKIFEASNNIVYIETLNYYDQSSADKEVVIWKSDGSELGTQKISDLNLNVLTKNNKGSIGVIGDSFYFNSIFKPFGYELCRSNDLGISLVNDRNKITFSSRPESFFRFGDEAYFLANNNTEGREVWKTDASNVGTSLKFDLTKVLPLSPISSSTITSQDFGILNDILIYPNHQENTLKAFNKTNNSIINLKSFSYSENNQRKEFTRLIDKLVFSDYFIGNGYELAITDGTPSGTTLLKDINPGFNSSYPNHLKEINGIVYFFANENGTNNSLWKTDGTSIGTQKIYDFLLNDLIISNDTNLINFNNKLYFSTYNNSTNNYNLWVADHNSCMIISSYKGFNSVTKPVILDNNLYFISTLFPYEINKIDLNSNLTTITSFSNYIDGLTVFNNEIYFKKINENGYFDLYKMNKITYAISLVNTNGDANSKLINIDENRLFIVSINNLDYINFDVKLKLLGSNGTLSELFKYSYTLRRIGGSLINLNHILLGEKLILSLPFNDVGIEPWVLDFSCPNSITLSSPISITQAHRSGNTIQLSSNVSSNLNIEANNKIEINPGTNIQQGTVFKAEIKGCN